MVIKFKFNPIFAKTKHNEMENTIYIHSFSKYGSREVSPDVFNRLKDEGKIHGIDSKHGGQTHYFFKPLVTITKQQA